MDARSFRPDRPDPVRRRLRLRLAAALALLALSLLLGLDSLSWFRLQRTLDRRLDGFAHAAAAEGWRFSARSGARGGWPFGATLTLLGPSLRSGPPGARFGWSGDAVTLFVPLLHAGRGVVLAQGTQELELDGLLDGLPGGHATLRFWGARIALRLPGHGRDANDAALLDADALHLALPGSGPDDVIQVAGLAARIAASPGPSRRRRFALRLDSVALPMVPGRPADRVIRQLGLDGTLQAAPGAAAWFRQAGAVLELDRATMDWNSLGAALSGRATLRADGALDGRARLAVDDADRLLRKLRDAGVLAPGPAEAARAVAGLIADGGNGQALRLDLMLRAGVLSLGAMPLLRLPRLRTAPGPG